jgi:streptomycin 3"-adenylyltransferase
VTGLQDRDEALAREVVDIVRTVLGDGTLVGAYLHGSAILGGLRGTSDVDVLAVIDRATTQVERRDIVDRLLDISGRRARRGPARPIEVTVVQAAAIKPWRFPPTAELQYGEWLRDDYERGFVPAPEPMADLAVIVTMALRGGATGTAALVGPPAADLLDPVPADDLRRSIRAGVPGLLAEAESDTRNVLLTLARIWCTLETGDIRTKDAAAAWAADRMPIEHREPIDRARRMYLDGVDEDHWGGRWPAAEAAARWLAGACQTFAP